MLFVITRHSPLWITNDSIHCSLPSNYQNLQKVGYDIVVFNGNVLGHAWHTWCKNGTNRKKMSCSLLIGHMQMLKLIWFRTMGLWIWITFFWYALYTLLREREDKSEPSDQDPDLEEIAQETSTDFFYQFGLALGLSYSQLDTIWYRTLKAVDHTTPGQEYNSTVGRLAGRRMLSLWKAMQPDCDLAVEHLRIIWKSLAQTSDVIETNYRIADECKWF